jgi:hypothetical protein
MDVKNGKEEWAEEQYVCIQNMCWVWMGMFEVPKEFGIQR